MSAYFVKSGVEMEEEPTLAMRGVVEVRKTKY